MKRKAPSPPYTESDRNCFLSQTSNRRSEASLRYWDCSYQLSNTPRYISAAALISEETTLGTGKLNAELKIIISSPVRSVCVSFHC